MKKQISEKIVVKDYSKDPAKEWKRTTKDPYHRLESSTTMHFLKRYLPKKGLVLDAGGGPGRYTIELAKKGYDVVLLDIALSNLDFAKKQIKEAKVENRVKDVLWGSITDLSKFPSNSFDAVICLGGPLSHVSEARHRKEAVSELVRVAKKGAPIFISVMGKFAVLAMSPAGWPEEVRLPNFIRLIETGDDHRFHGISYCHFFELKELTDLLSSVKNNKVIQTSALEGLSSTCEEAVNKLYKDKKAWRNWMKMHYALCTHPIVVDSSIHMLAICRKK